MVSRLLQFHRVLVFFNALLVQTKLLPNYRRSGPDTLLKSIKWVHNKSPCLLITTVTTQVNNT